MKDVKKIKKYAEALFKASSSSSQNLRSIINNLNLFKSLLKDVPELKYLILSKRVSLKDKHNIINNIFINFLGEIELELILLLISNGDASMYLDIVERFMYLIDSSSNIKKIQIISSNEYSDLDKEDIVKSIRQKFNIDNSSKAVFKVEGNMLGGIKIRIGNKIIDGSRISVGDHMIALGSSGPHSNGYSLIRKIMEKSKPNSNQLNSLIEPTKIYVKSILSLINKIPVNAISHITGGGLLENLPRVIII